MKNLKIALILVLAVAMSLSAEAKKVHLKYTLEKGAVFSFEHQTNQEIAQDMMGQTQEIISEMGQTIQFTVVDITDDGNYVIDRLVTRYKAVTSSVMGDVEFDSETSDKTGSIGELIDFLTTTPVQFVMSRNGTILEVKEIEDVSSRFSGLVNQESPEFQMVASLASQFTSLDGIKQNVNAILPVFPEKKVRTGKPWESTSSLEQMVEFKSTSSTMVNDVKGNTAFLTQDTKIEVGEGASKIEMEGMMMEYDLSGGKKGSFEVNTTTGLTTKAEGIVSISGVISIDSSQLPEPMTIPMTIKTTETIRQL